MHSRLESSPLCGLETVKKRRLFIPAVLKSGFLLLLSAFLFLGCSSSKITIKRVDQHRLTQGSILRPYTDYWETVQHGDFNPKIQDSSQARFVGALRSISDGRIAEAEQILRKEGESSRDTTVQKHSRTILRQLLFYQSKWNDLVASSQGNDTSELKNLGAFVKSMANVAPETYSYPSERREFELKLSMSGNPMMEVEINGRKRWFWIDTGATVSAIASDVAEECGALPLTEQKGLIKTATTKEIEYRPTCLDNFLIGPVLVRNHPAIILREEDLKFKFMGLITLIKIDGVIGWNAIKNLDMEIDYENKKVILRRPEKKPATERNLFWLGEPVVRLKSRQGVDLNFGIDTGSNKTRVSHHIIPKLGVSSTETKDVSVGGAGGFESIPMKVLRDVDVLLDSFNLHFAEIESHPSRHSEFLKTDGLIGSDIAKKGGFRFDFLNGRLDYFAKETEE